MASGDSSIAIGGDDVDLVATERVRYSTYKFNAQTGQYEQTDHDRSVQGALQELTGVGFVLAGTGRYAKTESGNYSVALGVKAHAKKELSVAVGTGSDALELNSLALGTKAVADQVNSVAIGGGSSTVDSHGKPETGTKINHIEYSWNGGVNTDKGDVVSFGRRGYERQLKNVAAGEVSKNSTDGINGSQLYAVAKAITDRVNYAHVNTGEATQVAGDANTNSGYIDAKGGATGIQAATFGINAKATAEQALAMGTNTQATGKYAVAVGSLAQASAESAIAMGNNSGISDRATSAIAIGHQANVGTVGADGGVNSIAIGSGATVKANNAGVIGQNSKIDSATASGSFAIGSGNTITTANTHVLGNSVAATQENSVILGHSSTDRAATTESNGSVGNITFGTFAGQGSAQKGVVSVGSAGNERQIINVAAGNVSADSTDTINGSQLYATNKVINTLATSVAAHLGGGSAVQADGSLSSPSYTIVAGNDDAEGNAGYKNQATKARTVAEGFSKLNEYINHGFKVRQKDVGEASGTVKGSVTPNESLQFENTADSPITVTVENETSEGITSVKFDVETSELEEDTANTGKLKAKDNKDNALIKASTLAKAINDYSFTAKANSETGDGFKVTRSSLLDFKEGDSGNLSITRTNGTGEFIFDISKTPTFENVTSDKFTVKDGPVIGNNGIDMKDKTITNITSGLGKYENTNTKKDGLVNLEAPTASNTGVSDKTAATVGDLRNMGWVVSADKTTGNLTEAYSDTVKNANEVKFVGTGLATVSGKSENGVRTITVDVDAQAVTNRSQLPVVYTKADGTKVYKVGNDFFTDPAGTGTPLSDAEKKALVSSMVNPDGTTNSPTTLANVKSNFAVVNDTDNNAKNPDGTAIDDSTATKAPESPAASTHNNAATVSDVLNAGFNLQGNGEAKDFVRHGDTLNFADGDGTTVSVSTTDNKTSTVKVNLNVDGETIDLVEDGTAQDPKPKKLKAVTQNITADQDNKGKVKADDNKPNALATAKNVAEMINQAGFLVKANAEEDTAATKISAGDTLHLEATEDSNLTIERNGGKFTFNTKDEVKFKKVTIADGAEKGPELSKDGIDMNNKAITNISSGLSNYADPEPKKGGLLNLEKPTAPNTGVSDKTAATVGDLRNMGWVVSSDKTTNGTGEYSDTVKNANEVKFVGTGLATVSGKSENGVRTITVDVNAQTLTNNSELPVAYTKADGTKVYRKGNKFYTDPAGTQELQEEDAKDVMVSLNNAEPNKPMTLANVKSNFAVVNDTDNNAKNPDGTAIDGSTATKAPESPAASTHNNAATVSDVLNTGFNLQGNGNAVDFVRHSDTLNFADGDGTTVSVSTTDKKTSTVKVNLNVDGDTLELVEDGTAQDPKPKKLKAVTQDITADQDNKGKVKADDQKPNALATAKNVADMINDAGFLVKANREEDTAATKISAGDTLHLEATEDGNLTIARDKGKFTFNTKDEVTFKKVTIADGAEKGPELSKDGINMNDNKITGLADGNVAAGSKEAVTGGQLHDLVEKGWSLQTGKVANSTGKNTNTHEDTSTVSLGSLVTINAGNNIEVEHNSQTHTLNIATSLRPEFNELTIKPNGKVDLGGNRIQNVGRAVAPSDAVNYGQFKAELGQIDRDLRAGIAGATAMAFLQRAVDPGRSLVSVAVGGYRGEHALAVGFSRNTDNNRVSIKVGMGFDTRRQINYGGSIGYQW